jgi:hypothetical protein
MKNLQQKAAMAAMAFLVTLSMVGCGDIGDIKPVEGDNRTAAQMTNEMAENLETGIRGGVFNQVWTK